MSDNYTAIPVENRWRGQLQPSAVVISIIHRSRFEQSGGSRTEYLLIRRKGGPYRGYWALVGGKWDFGESLTTAALREIEEETQLVCRFDSLLGVANERVEIGTVNNPGGAHFLLFVCLAASPDGEAIEQDEGEVAWFSREEIEELNESERIIPSDYAMFTHFLGADPIPYVEVEMESGTLDSSDCGSTRLKRFDINS